MSLPERIQATIDLALVEIHHHLWEELSGVPAWTEESVERYW